MRKSAAALLCGVAALFLTSAVSSRSTQTSYGEDRAQIEDLQARYAFAMDFRDPETCARTFTEDAVLDYGTVHLKGRAAIQESVARMAKIAQDEAAKDTSGLRPSVGRHNISNIVVKIEGNKAVGRAYWFYYSNNNPTRTGTLLGYGHYEDEMVKVDGQWLFSKRKIYNEMVADSASKPGNPAW
jgi:3-phenylpropionate/cinnamic acid dioxygenase small subunit